MHLITTLAVALAGAALFELLRVPAGAIIGAMLAVTVFNLSNSVMAATLPRPAQFAAFAAIGWLIGQGITKTVLHALASSAILVAVSVSVLVIFGGFLAIVLVRLGVDPATAFLATSPGGLSQMSALSVAVGADSSLVTTMHIVRVVVVILVAPLVVSILPGGG